MRRNFRIRERTGIGLGYSSGKAARECPSKPRYRDLARAFPGEASPECRLHHSHRFLWLLDPSQRRRAFILHTRAIPEEAAQPLPESGKRDACEQRPIFEATPCLPSISPGQTSLDPESTTRGRVPSIAFRPRRAAGRRPRPRPRRVGCGGGKRIKRLINHPWHTEAMRLDLTDEEAAALLSLLNRVIADDRYPLSPRIRLLRAVHAKLPGAPPEPPAARPPTPEERTRGRAPRVGRPRR